MRAAAVSSLARFGAAVAELHPRIVVLLRRALFDNDDEVCWLLLLDCSMGVVSMACSALTSATDAAVTAGASQARAAYCALYPCYLQVTTGSLACTRGDAPACRGDDKVQ